MPKTKEILAFIKNAPGPVTNGDLCNAFGMRHSSAATRTKLLMDKGVLTRAVYGVTTTGTQIYGYTPTGVGIAPRKPGRKSAVAKSGITRNNVDIGSLIDQLASNIVEQIVSRAKSQLHIELTRLLPEQVSRPVAALPDLVQIDQAPMPTAEQVIARAAEANAPVQPKVKKQKVLVMCLLPRQAGQIQAEFHDTFDLFFWSDNAGDSTDRLKTLARNAEVVFNHIDHCSHRASEIVQSVGARVIRVNGGLGQMRDALTKYYVEEVAS